VSGLAAFAIPPTAEHRAVALVEEDPFAAVATCREVVEARFEGTTRHSGHGAKVRVGLGSCRRTP